MAGASGLGVQVGGAFGRVGDQPLGVVVGAGVGVVGVQVEVHAGVAEVVLQPPPRTHPVDDLRRAQVGAGGEHVHLAQVIYRMGARWRLENYFRYARMHFDLDSHHCYASADDDPQRLVPNPAKRAARSPAPGTQTILTNPVHDAITADLRAAGADLAAAQQAHKTIPTRVPLGELHPGQQVLDVETKLITHAISAAAFNTINALARDIRSNRQDLWMKII